MIFPKGVPDVLVRPEGGLHEIKTVYLDQVYLISLCKMRPRDIWNLRDADIANRQHLVGAVPVYYAWDPEKDLIMLYPVPDKDYTAFVRYYPAIREL